MPRQMTIRSCVFYLCFVLFSFCFPIINDAYLIDLNIEPFNWYSAIDSSTKWSRNMLVGSTYGNKLNILTIYTKNNALFHIIWQDNVVSFVKKQMNAIFFFCRQINNNKKMNKMRVIKQSPRIHNSIRPNRQLFFSFKSSGNLTQTVEKAVYTIATYVTIRFVWIVFLTAISGLRLHQQQQKKKRHYARCTLNKPFSLLNIRS